MRASVWFSPVDLVVARPAQQNGMPFKKVLFLVCLSELARIVLSVEEQIRSSSPSAFCQLLGGVFAGEALCVGGRSFGGIVMCGRSGGAVLSPCAAMGIAKICLPK